MDNNVLDEIYKYLNNPTNKTQPDAPQIEINTVNGVITVDTKDLTPDLLNKRILFNSWESYARERYIESLSDDLLNNEKKVKIAENDAKSNRSFYQSQHRRLKRILLELGINEDKFKNSKNRYTITVAVADLYDKLLNDFLLENTKNEINRKIKGFDANKKISYRNLLKDALYSVELKEDYIIPELKSFETATGCLSVSDEIIFPICTDVVIDAATYIEQDLEKKLTDEEKVMFYEKMNYDYRYCFRPKIIEHAFKVLEEIRE